jgi:hypothetical protein
MFRRLLALDDPPEQTALPFSSGKKQRLTANQLLSRISNPFDAFSFGQQNEQDKQDSSLDSDSSLPHFNHHLSGAADVRAKAF